MQPETKACQKCKKEFVIDTRDLAFYEEIQVPPPTQCPECRLVRRLTWRNERSLYRRDCGLCGKAIISMHDSESDDPTLQPIQSYCPACWFSDKWDPMASGRDFDFSRPFFAQFRELLEATPHISLGVDYTSLVNTEFTNMNHQLKNCYWLFNSDYDENCRYGEEVERSKDCMDATMIDQSELVYGSLNCTKCSRVYFSVDCESSHDIVFSKNLVGCSDCFGCINLRNQKYHIFNEPYSKDEYHKKVSEFNLGGWKNLEALKKRVHDLWLREPQKYIHGKQNVNVSGDYIYNSKNVRDSFIVNGSENCRYCMWLIVGNNKDCYDYTQFGENTQYIYEGMVNGKNVRSVLFSMWVLDSYNIFYSHYCPSNNHDLFGCAGLRSKEYCILNKQYTKEDYEALVPKIIEHMKKTGEYGEFFPAALSQFAYNETSAQEFFPLTETEAREKGFRWKKNPDRDYVIEIPEESIPDSIENVRDDIVGKVIGCKHAGECAHQCSTAFRIIQPELEMYRAMKIALPHLCPNCRHYERVEFRNPVQLWDRTCAKCTKPVQTSYSPDRPEIVCCEGCYNAEVA